LLQDTSGSTGTIERHFDVSNLVAILDARGILPDGDCDVVTLTGGRTNCVYRVGRLAVLKIYNRAANNLLFPNNPDLEVLSLSQLYSTGITPELLGHGKYAGRDWVLYRHLEGQTWTTDVASVARLLHKVHQNRTLDGLPKRRGGSRKIESQASDLLSKSGVWAKNMAPLPKPISQVAPVSQVCLIHGDPVPENFVIGPAGLSLIDWQCPALGDPSEDIAMFLSPAMQTLYGRNVLNSQQLAEFLGAYPDRATVSRYRHLAGWYHWRMAAYCLYQASLGSDDYAAAFELERDALRFQMSAK
jgi:thiamine kinase-like enzyme